MYLVNFIKTFISDPVSDYKIIDIIVKLIMVGLILLAISGILVLLFRLFRNPSDFNDAQFGIFDYI
jgi:hypothetical protein